GKQGFSPERLSLEVDSAHLPKIAQLTEDKDISTSVFFLTCWQVLFWRVTGQSNLVIGAACDGRTYEELQGTLGLLAKYLPVACHLEENLRFTDVLQNVNKTVDEHLEWQEYFSWEEIAATDSGVAFFPVCFSFEEFPEVSLKDMSFSLAQQYAYIDRFKVKLACVQRDDSLITEFHYDSNVFRTEDVERLSEQFHVLLKSILDNPETTVGDFDILSDSERKQILVEFNDTGSDHPADKCIHHLIAERVEKTPDSTAVMFENEKLSYAKLNQRANQLAHHLQKVGVGPETPVGIYIEPSLELMVGLLGILKSGGAYVPLDPEYPTERLASILEDTQAPVVLTQSRLQSAIPKNNTRVVCLDADWQTIAAESDANPSSDATPENLAYIIFTSGSTGKPKGVPISHRNLVHSTYARLVYYKEPVGRFLLLSSFSFDSSIVGLFWSLCSGGTLVLPEAGLQRDPQPVAELIASQQITHMLCLPSLYSLILSEAEPKKLSSLDTVIVAGEACTKNVVDRHNELFPETGLFNEYGPTEGTVWCTVFDCRSKELETQVPIGRPIANSQIYLLNANMRPVPIGVPGELYIGGVGLTRGYLNRPELTADILVPNPFDDEVGSRLYKTGDLARYLPEGNIEFLGRADHQVKIRGYRIELGEIEAVLSQHSSVTQSVVVASESSQPETPASGDRRLVAYVVPGQNEQPKITELRSFINEQLPDFMVPSAFVFLESLPLTPNGKVDRNALPEPDRARPDLEETFVPPRNPVEEVLCGIWAEVLNIEKAGIQDNFFDLGGHSILVTRLVSRIRDSLQVELPLRTVFETPTVAALSDALLKDPEKRSKVEKTAELLVKLANLSDEEAEAMLNKRA
ncbi:MAG: amino acid adenylation domain-containing protein, partial [Phycisphaerae bacterium]|nr:amino acid adenylation domain-containing protein [candidate division KSB1 bacterium]NIV00721.1 amino acid adenylation domain-containing protein [Phycisphaerae bacterium]NIR71198.1 amino acid adenylation domain-containing protein [candidate division KSB1 bacterium]NIT71230.1 amino acid adenylation domain-containing protein [candidate division KSB1 bacterium]NIU24934.1 amino acid adenylation domain-containing protein [candidate division KSB1 bacterium]